MPDKSLEWQIANDAKHLVFTLSRYKFVAKMFHNYQKVLEIGCGNGFGGHIVRQSVKNLTVTDIDSLDISKSYLEGFDGVYMLDVFEHIDKKHENTALENLARCAPVCIIGTPSIESQKYASEESRKLHVNCVSGDYLREICQKHWKNVFMFGMNDETLHTGFLPMSHYLFALCVEKKNE